MIRMTRSINLTIVMIFSGFWHCSLRNSVNEKFSKSKDFVENMQKKLLMKAYDDEGSDEFDMQ